MLELSIFVLVGPDVFRWIICNFPFLLASPICFLFLPEIGREKISSGGTIPSLLNWCRSLLEMPGKRYGSIVNLVSSVVQRCNSARPLPVRKLNNPVVFAFSESFCLNESDSSGDLLLFFYLTVTFSYEDKLLCWLITPII